MTRPTLSIGVRAAKPPRTETSALRDPATGGASANACPSTWSPRPAGFRQDASVVKARNDLTALLYADGIHDSLYRCGGNLLLNRSGPTLHAASAADAVSAAA
jgi:hypothetical protein